MNFKLFPKTIPLVKKYTNNFNIENLKQQNRNEFIEKNKNFIYKTTYKICKRNLNWENDDELSIALIAFNKACDNYNDSKGNFYSYAKVIIRNSIIDYFRKNKNTPYLLFDNEENNIDLIDTQNSLSEYEIKSENELRQIEIQIFCNELEKYKISFDSLINSSPSHKDTRDNLLNIAISCMKDESILNYIRSKKRLPIKQIVLLNNCNKRLIERWRIYIIALIIILSNKEYSYIKSYLNIKVGDKNA